MIITALVFFVAAAVLSQAGVRLFGGPAVSAKECVRQAQWLRAGRGLVTLERAASPALDQSAYWL